jgi:hypothetical protein
MGPKENRNALKDSDGHQMDWAGKTGRYALPALSHKPLLRLSDALLLPVLRILSFQQLSKPVALLVFCVL